MGARLTWLDRFRRSQEGGALAEAAVVLPLLLLLIFAMIWFGMLIYTHTVVQIAAAQGARVGAAAYADDPDSTKTPPPDEKARGFVRSVVQAGLNQSDLEAIAMRKEQIDGEDAVRVTVTYRFKLLVPFMSDFGATNAAAGGGVPVVKSSVYRIELVNP